MINLQVPSSSTSKWFSLISYLPLVSESKASLPASSSLCRVLSAHLPSTPHPNVSLLIQDWPCQSHTSFSHILSLPHECPPGSSSSCLLNFKDNFQKIYLVTIKLSLCIQALSHIHSQECGTSPISIQVQERRASDLKLSENCKTWHIQQQELPKSSFTCLTWSQHVEIGQCRHSTFSLPGQGALGLCTHTGSHKCQLGLKAATGTRPTTSAYCQLAFIPISLPPNTTTDCKNPPWSCLFDIHTGLLHYVILAYILSNVWLHFLNYQHSEHLKQKCPWLVSTLKAEALQHYESNPQYAKWPICWSQITRKSIHQII